MKDYVYPTTDQGDMTPNPLQPVIDWGDVEARLAQASSQERPADMTDVLDYLKTAGNADHLKDFQFKSDKDSDESEDSKEEDEDFVKQGKEASSSPRKIVFSSKEQLSPQALQDAKDSGDVDLYNTILAARQQQRVKVAQQAEANMAELVENKTKLAARSSYRARIVSAAKKAAAKSAKIASTKTKPEVASAPVFVEPSKLTVSAREAIVRKAASLGFPEEYTKAIMASSTPVNSSNSAIFEVLASDMKVEVKKAAVASMVRSAELSTEDESRLRKYWVEDLGYDAAWVEDLLTSYGKK